LLPHLFNYLREHGPDVKRLDTIKSSFRAWIGFLMQDPLGTGAMIADITPASPPASGAGAWGRTRGKSSGAARFRHQSNGVSGLRRSSAISRI
jgi:hypothetical protein